MDSKTKLNLEKSERYNMFTILDEPVKFSELYKDTDIQLVQVHSIEPVGDDDIVGFCGVFRWERNHLSPLDGDIYNPDVLVQGYSWFSAEDNPDAKCLDILVGNDW